MAYTPTPHIAANPGDFAETVLMPGDPLRSKHIAETYLQDPILVNNVRGVQGYTGIYHGKRVSVMASGMGMPAIGIYSYELFHFYGVENIIRIGTAGALDKRLGLRDLCAGVSCFTNSTFGDQYGFAGKIPPTASYKLLRRADEAAEKLGVTLHVGPLLSTDVFYEDQLGPGRAWARSPAKWKRRRFISTPWRPERTRFACARFPTASAKSFRPKTGRNR